MSNQFLSSNYLVVDSNFLVVVYLTDFSYLIPIGTLEQVVLPNI